MATSVLGIDFGTSCTKAAVVVDGRIRLVLDDAQSHISSIVQVPRQGAMAAVPLAELDRVDPSRTITSIKRLLGRSYSDPRIKELDAGVGYHIVRGADGSAHVRVDQVEISPIQVVAAVLRNARELGERLVGHHLDRAVLAMPVRTCPGYIPALTRAAQIAGLTSVRLVYEPVAALWGSMTTSTGEPRRILISDFGAGTYDCALLDVRPDRVDVLACGGDELLGGDDFDLALADRVAGDVFREERADIRRDRVFWTGMLRACERAKRRLSRAPTTHLHLERAFVKDGAARDLSVPLDRAELEPCWRPLVDRAVGAARDTLMRARTPPELVDDLILAGGTSLMPLVRNAFVKRMGRQPTAVCGSDVVIAAGLALMGTHIEVPAPMAHVQGR